ncbi:type II secretion system minor pseudopilin GspK [Microbulbifer hydrolyticus]|uniref:Type II secretion system protein K n=1 Tax=Microbulbifer hydrolyticus TaxID=48074 RepID=A0A6P1T8E3_9GAMM|nr:type II secretion system minor pseudopilin GspK [Microbulbifer hydrolyticus]MBB5210450.1 general secretion pathway protein K [Microbulbifer hydrolyticus]QHQ39068.1 type II secretion system minor pseudopilin GspK [Microbulbifer hydrolyticus]
MIVANPERQRGVALITVLLVMVIAVAAVTHAVTRNRLAISRTSAILANTQLAEFVHGAEAWSIIALEKDFEEDRAATAASDNLLEPWAQKLVEFNPDNGKIRIQIKDLQSCFNVNNLTMDQAAGGGPGGGEASASKVLQRLVRNLGGRADTAMAIEDWVDPGDTPLSSGTEDNGYLGQEVAHRTPDTFITDVSELSAGQGIEPQEWKVIAPELCALPESGTKVNVNTASQELLSAMFPSANVAGLINYREGGTPFTDAGELSGFGITGGGELDFNSAYYVAHIAVQLGLEHRQYWESTLKLDTTTGEVKVIQRQRREFSGQFLQELLGD